MNERKRLMIYLEGGVIQGLFSPDGEENLDVIVKDIDTKSEILPEKIVSRYTIDKISEEDWKTLDEQANREEL